MATRYWVGGSGVWDSSSSTHWSATSGGASGASAPTGSDIVIFNSASSGASYIVSCSYTAACGGITTTAPAAGTLTFAGSGTTFSDYYFQVYTGNINIHAACLFTNAGQIYHENGGVGTLSVTFNGGGGSGVFYYYQHNNASYNPTLNFCNSSSATLAAVQINCLAGVSSYTTPNLTSAVLTLNDNTSGSNPYFTINSANNVTLTSATLNFGAVSGTSLTQATISISAIGTVSHTGLSIIEQRPFVSRSYQLTQATTDYSISALTLLGSDPSALTSTVTGIQTIATLSVTNIGSGIYPVNFSNYNSGTTFTVSTSATITKSAILLSFTGTKTFQALTLATSGIIYTNGANVVTAAFNATGASQFNGIINTSSAGTLTLNGACTLVNCHLACQTITVAGGASNNFAYSLSTPVANPNLAYAATTNYGTTYDTTFPELISDTFTLTSSGGTFSIAGGATANYRAFVRPYSMAASNTACTMSLAVNPTLTDVDFWRVTPAGSASTPWTGTRIGAVGTLTNITAATPKTVYWVGGAGTWNTSASWATTSGGSGAVANYPLPQDTVTFTSSSGTGAVQFTAAIRVGSLIVSGIAAGQALELYGYNSVVTDTVWGGYAMWVSKNIDCSLADGTFSLGSPTTSSSFGTSLAYSKQRLVIADSSSSDTHTINSSSYTLFFKNQGIYMYNFGSVSFNNSITTPLWAMDTPVNSTTGTVSFLGDQYGSSSAGDNLNYLNYGTTYGGFSLGRYGSSYSLGSASFYASSFSLFSKIADTVYTVNPALTVTINSGLTTVGKVTFFTYGVGATYGWRLIAPATTTTFKSITATQTYSSGAPSVYFSASGATIATYAMSVSQATTFLNNSGGTITFSKPGGGKVGVGAATITATGGTNYAMNATPASTWYTTGTIGAGNTGWNSGSAPSIGGPFAFF